MDVRSVGTVTSYPQPGPHFEDKFNDFVKLELCVVLTANPLMEAVIGEISEQMAELFRVGPVGMEKG